MARSVVTPERFAKGRTFDEYVKYTGSAGEPRPRGLRRLFSRRRLLQRPAQGQQRGLSRALREDPAQRRPGGRHQVAGRPARRPREHPGDLGGLVVGLPARRAGARPARRGGRAPAPHLQPRRQEDPGHAHPRSGGRSRRQPRPHARVPEQEERRGVGVGAGGGLLHQGLHGAPPLLRVPRHLQQGRHPRARRAQRAPGRARTRRKSAPCASSWRSQASPFFDVWASAAVAEILSALHEKLLVGDK